MKVGKKVKEIIRAQLTISELAPIKKSYLKSDFDFDSLDEIELIMEIEEAFGIEISDEEAFKLNTVGDLIKLVKSKP